MPYISLIIYPQMFDMYDNLQEVVGCKSFGDVRLTGDVSFKIKCYLWDVMSGYLSILLCQSFQVITWLSPVVLNQSHV